LAGNESQWPAQYPHDNWHAAEGQAGSQDDQPTQVRPATPDISPAAPWAPPATRYGPPPVPPVPSVPQVPPAGYPVPAAGYPVQPAGFQVPPAGYYVPPAGHPVPSAGYQVQAHVNAGMRAASADRERAVDVLKAGFAEGRLTQDEYNERMGRAYAARTYGELTALTADLPAGAMPAVWPMSVYQPPVTTNSLARASLVLGVAEFFTMGLTAIPAIICGHMAKREMRQTGQRGDGLATSGLVLGYMAVIFWGILIALSIVGAVIQASGSGGFGG